jgi:anti-sigma factor ChrR (cupin superfamily)
VNLKNLSPAENVRVLKRWTGARIGKHTKKTITLAPILKTILATNAGTPQAEDTTTGYAVNVQVNDK